MTPLDLIRAEFNNPNIISISIKIWSISGLPSYYYPETYYTIIL